MKKFILLLIILGIAYEFLLDDTYSTYSLSEETNIGIKLAHVTTLVTKFIKIFQVLK